MDFHGIWQSVLSNGLYALLIFAGGVVLTILKKRGSQWFNPLLWGLVGCGLVSVVVIAFVIISRIPKPPPDINPETLEVTIRGWLDRFGWSTKRTDDSAAVFALTAMLDNGNIIGIGRPKADDHYIVLATRLPITIEVKAQLDSMPKADADLILANLRAEMARVNMAYDMSQPDGITLTRSILISNNLTEGVFLDNLQGMNSAIALARITFARDIQAHALKAKS